MKILVVTSMFPNCEQPTLGVFVRERMFRVARQCELKVVAPVPWFPFMGILKPGYRPLVPFREVQDGVEVLHPRFFNVPGIFKCLDGFFFFLSALATVARVRRQFRFDVIDAHFAYPDGMGAVLLGKVFGVPVTITLRGTIRKLSRYLLRRVQIRYALGSAARVFTVCQDLKRAATDLGISPDHVEVVPNGVDLAKFRRVDQGSARSELGLPVGCPIIISVGGLVERKGFHRVIEVLPALRRQFPGLTYVVVGGPSVEGNYEPELRRMVDELELRDAVVFAGPQPHDRLHLWLSAADLFCLATSNEGWANVFLEAMACGLPVVTTRVGGNEEVVPSEEYGLLVGFGSSGELHDALARALQRDWDRDGIIAYARENTWDRRVVQLMRAFGEVGGHGMDNG